MRFLCALVLGSLSLVLWKFSPVTDGGLLQDMADGLLLTGATLGLGYCLFTAVLHGILTVDETHKRNRSRRDFHNKVSDSLDRKSPPTDQ